MNWNISLCLLWDVCVFPVDFISLINHWQISNILFSQAPRCYSCCFSQRTMFNTKSKHMWVSVTTKNLRSEGESLSLILEDLGSFGTGSLFCILFHRLLAAYTAIQTKCKLWMTSYRKPVDDASFPETLTVHFDTFWMSSCDWEPATNHISHQHHDSQAFRRIMDCKRKGRDIAAADQFSQWYHRTMFKPWEEITGSSFFF